MLYIKPNKLKLIKYIKDKNDYINKLNNYLHIIYIYIYIYKLLQYYLVFYVFVNYYEICQDIFFSECNNTLNYALMIRTRHIHLLIKL